MKKKITLFLCIVQTLLAQEYIVFRGKPHGMFSVLHFVLYYLQQYERNEIQGLHIDFADKGIYYDAQHGLNWWEYYFEEINLWNGKPCKVRIVEEEEVVDPSIIEFNNSIAMNHDLLTKYVKVKPHILNKIEAFQTEHFSDKFVIGVHYRGTDKLIYEAKRVDYWDIVHSVNHVIASIPNQKDYTIFVATDEYLFLHYMLYRYGDKVCFSNAIRSKTYSPVHHDQNRDPYKVGEDAVIDAYLLSRVDFLVRTTSNLSLCSRYMNPNLPVIELSQRSEAAPCPLKTY